MTKSVRSLLFVLVLLSFVLAACGPAATEAPTAAPTEAMTEAPTEVMTESPTAEAPADPMAEHAGLPVTRGVKLLASLWMRERRFVS